MINVVIAQSEETYRTCFHCGSRLVFIERKVEDQPHHFSPTITTIYKCSNQKCQSVIDKTTRDRIKKTKELQRKKVPAVAKKEVKKKLKKISKKRKQSVKPRYKSKKKKNK